MSLKTLSIPVILKNAGKIETHLSEVNGKATTHTFTTFAAIADQALWAEGKLERLGFNKAQRRGATFEIMSGDKLPSAYKHAAKITWIKIDRNKTGWVLTCLASGERYPGDDNGSRLTLTAEQDQHAITKFRSAYRVEGF